MILEEKFFLEIITDYINQKETTPRSDDFNWESLWRIAKNHEMTGVIYHQCKSFIPKNIIDTYESTYSATLFTAANRANMLKKIEEAFAQNSIANFIVKGGNVAKYYPLPALRTMGDTDIVIHAEDRPLAHKLLIELGFYPKVTDEQLEEWQYVKGNLHVEIHNCIVHKNYSLSPAISSFFSNPWEYVQNGEIDESFHYLFVVMHLYSHFKSGGVGIRQFLDVAILTKYCKNLDFNWIKEKLILCDLYDFTSIVFNINKIWFDVEMPMSVEKISESLYDEVSAYVLSNGVFGKNNEDNSINVKINIIPKVDNKFMHILRTLFPPYSYLARCEDFSFIKGKKYLLPYVWVYRLFYNLFHGKAKSSLLTIFKPKLNKESYNNRLDFLSRCGIKKS